jgi:hypothetical protein
MHAVIGRFAMDTRHKDEQRKELTERIIPMVRTLPGFISGYWSYDEANGESFSYIVLENEAQAHALIEKVQANVADRGGERGVSVKHIAVAEVWGQARS